MLVVLAILGAIAAGAAVVLRPVRERNVLTRSGAVLTELISRAHASAIREGRPVLMRFNPEQRRISIDGMSMGATLDASVTLSLTTAREVGTNAEQAILFLPDGTGSGGKLRLAIAGSEAAARTLRVSWLTGVVAYEH